VSHPSCGTPLSIEVLGDYWAGDIASGEEERLEEHLLSCDACSRRLREVADLAGSVLTIARSGVLRAVVSDAWLDRLSRSGLHVRRYDVAPGGSLACTVTPQDDLVTARLSAPLADALHVDLVLCDSAGIELERVRDVPHGPSAKTITVIEPIDLLRRLPESVLRMKLVSLEEGGERLLGEYTFNHTPTPHP
jgi:hypothetical protein